MDHFGLYKYPPVEIRDVNVSYSTKRSIGPLNVRNYTDLYFVYSFKCSHTNINYTYSKIEWVDRDSSQVHHYPYNSGSIVNIRGWIPDQSTWCCRNYFRDEGPCLTDNVTTLNYPNITYLTNVDHATALSIGLTGGWELTLGKVFGRFNTLSPTVSPTSSPTNATYSPTFDPTTEPSGNPTLSPSQPTTTPSAAPTLTPSQPTTNPTNTPSSHPTNPTRNPTISPTGDPSVSPSLNPTRNPTISPTGNPSVSPSIPSLHQFIC